MQNLHFDDIVLCGDFNCVLNNDSDIISDENHAQGTVTKFNDVLNECNLFDTWRLTQTLRNTHGQKEIHLLPEDWIIF